MLEMLAIIVSIIALIVLVKLSRESQKADADITVKSRQTLEKYDAIKFFKENREKLIEAENVIKENARADEASYKIRVHYVSPAGRKSAIKDIIVRQYDIDRLKEDPSLLMGKGEYNKYIKEQGKEALERKQHEY